MSWESRRHRSLISASKPGCYISLALIRALIYWLMNASRVEPLFTFLLQFCCCRTSAESRSASLVPTPIRTRRFLPASCWWITNGVMSEQQLFIPATFGAVTLEMPARWRSWKGEKMACGEEEGGGLQVKQSTRFRLLFPGLQLCRTRRVGSPQVELQMHPGWNEGKGWSWQTVKHQKSQNNSKWIPVTGSQTYARMFFPSFQGPGGRMKVNENQ